MEPRVVKTKSGTFHIVEGRSTIIQVCYNLKRAKVWLSGYVAGKTSMKGNDNG